MKKILGLIILFAFLLTPHIFAQTTYFVDGSNGSDSNNGTSPSSAWRTLGKANSTLIAGDTVYIRGGNYYAFIRPNNSGSSGNYITYARYQNEEPTIRDQYTAVDLRNKHYIVIDGIKVVHSISNGGWVNLGYRDQPCSYNIVQNCRFEGADEYNGLYMHGSQSHHNQILNNTFVGVCDQDTPQYGGPSDLVAIKVGAHHNLVQGNTFLNATHNAIDCNNSPYNIIKDNYIQNRWHTGINIYSSNYDGSHHCIVEGNMIVDSGDICDAGGCPQNLCGSSGDQRVPRKDHAGLQFGSQSSIIRQNVFINNGIGINTTSDWGTNSKGYHNTFYDNFYGLHINSSNSIYDNWYKNNIINDHSYFDIRQQTSGSPKDNYYFSNLLSGTSIRYEDDGDKSISWLQSNYPSLFRNNISGDPRFVNAGNRNLRLQSNSPAIDAGGFLTETANSGSGTELFVQDASYFSDGLGLIAGDVIQLEGQSQTAQVVYVDYGSDRITLDRALTWGSGQGVSLAYSGSAPDIGAYEYQGSTPLNADANGSPTSGYTPLTVNFTGNATGGTSPYSYSWNFGDGGSSTLRNPSHTFNGNGDFTAVLTVTDNASDQDSDSIIIHVSIPALTASLGASPTSGQAPLTVNFTGSASGGTSPYSYSWNFGDGGSSTSQNPSHTFTQGGNYNVVLTVTDNASSQDTDSVTINVTDPASLNADMNASPTSGLAPLSVNFTGSASGGTPPYSYSWNFGDGGSSTSQNPSHTFTQPGNYTVVLTVTDNASNHDTDNGTINVSSQSSTFTLSMSMSTGSPAPGSGGTVNPSPGDHDYNSGTNVQIEANPNTSYRFSRWTGDVNSDVVGNSELVLTMSANKSVSAKFCTRCGDLNGDLFLTPSDAQLVFDIFLGLEADPTLCQRENGDVNSDGTPNNPSITPYDAQAIFDYYLGKHWLPSDCSMNSRASTSGALATMSREFPEFNLLVQDQMTLPGGDEILVPVMIDQSIRLESFGFDLAFDSDFFEFVEVIRAELTENFLQVGGNVVENGVLRVGGYIAESLEDSSPGELVILIFRVKQDPVEPTSFSVIKTYDDLKNADIGTERDSLVR